MYLSIYSFLLLLYVFTPYKAHSKQQITTFSETESISEEEHDLFQQCATDICGPADRDLFRPDNEHLKFFIDKESFDKTVTIDPKISSKFNKDVQPIIRETLQNLEEILDTLRNTLQKLNSGNYSSEWDGIGKDIAHYYATDRESDPVFSVKVESESDYQRQQFFTNELEKSKASEQTTSFCSEAICRKMVREELLYLQANLEQSIQSAKNNMSQYLKYCESVYAVTIMQDQQIKIYRENLEQYKAKFLNMVFTDYSMESREQFANYINNKFTIITHSADGTQRFTKMINDTNTATKIASRQKFSFMNAMNSLPKNNSVCSPHIAKQKLYSSSNFIRGEDKMLTGFVNYFFPEHGKQIFAHELAHALSEQFTRNRLSSSSYQKYRELRNCATKRFKFDDTDTLARDLNRSYHENDKLSSEENTADLIAYKVFQSDPTIALCLQIGPSKRGGTQYRNLRMIDLEDNYSPPFLRIIMEAIHKRIELPESCQQIVNIYSNRINFDPCF